MSAIDRFALSKTVVLANPSGLTLPMSLLAASNMLEEVFPSGSIVAIGRPAGSNTVVEVNPRALVVLTRWLAAS